MTDQNIPAGLTRDQAQAVREWAERSYAAKVQDETMYHAARVLLAVLPTPPTTAKENPELPDQIPADKVREILDEWERIKEYGEWDDVYSLVKDIRALLPTPPTLADMTLEDRRECRRMQCDVEGRSMRYVIANPHENDGEVTLLDSDGGIDWVFPEYVTPRPDLPRLTWPGDTPSPAPALPGGWRSADHKDYGRVIVTTPTPDPSGHVYFVAPTADSTGCDRFFCDPARLTYLEQ